MTGVADNEANVVLAGKVHRSDDLIARRNVHRVIDKVAELAGLRLGGVRVAGLVGKVRLHHRRGRVQAGGD
jgi:hypothetical protein